MLAELTIEQGTALSNYPIRGARRSMPRLGATRPSAILPLPPGYPAQRAFARSFRACSGAHVRPSRSPPCPLRWPPLAAADDHLLPAPGEIDVPVLGHVTEVSAVDPSVATVSAVASDMPQ